MLLISNIAELREKVAHKEEIRETKIPSGFEFASDLTTFCYMIAVDDTFNDAHSRECRGIVFNDRGDVVGRPLHKFFNVNEREETQVHKLDWSKITRVMDKRDGSMIHTVIVSVPQRSGEPTQSVRMKSKKSFDSDVARMAHNWALQFREYQAFFKKVVELDVTAIFEWTSPEARIVLYYPEHELRLLHVRDNKSGRYWTRDELVQLIEPFKIIKLVDEPTFDVPKEKLGEHLLQLAQTAENTEGWVVQFEDGEMVKLKTAWYLKRHRAMTFLRERDIASMVLDQSLDDLKALLVTEGVDILPIIEIENRVLSDIRALERAVNELADPEDYKMDRKSFVFKYREKAGSLFGLLMDKYSGKKPDYIDFFERNMLKVAYTLRQLNLVPSVAEAE